MWKVSRIHSSFPPPASPAAGVLYGRWFQDFPGGVEPGAFATLRMARTPSPFPVRQFTDLNVDLLLLMGVLRTSFSAGLRGI
jgi:hypothetical protein